MATLRLYACELIIKQLISFSFSELYLTVLFILRNSSCITSLVFDFTSIDKVVSEQPWAMVD